LIGNINESKNNVAQDMFRSTKIKKRLSLKKEAIEDKVNFFFTLDKINMKKKN